MSFLGMRNNRDSWVHRASASNGFSNGHRLQSAQSGNETQRITQQDTQLDEVNRAMSNMTYSRPSSSNLSPRPNSASNKQSTSQFNRYKAADSMKRDTTEVPSPQKQRDTKETHQKARVPKFVETEKQVLRFYCHFFEKDVPELGQRRQKVASSSTPRFFTLRIYVEDNTFEISEERCQNSGIQGGAFYRRGPLKKGSQSFEPSDFSVGSSFSALGQEFFITDCDEFTREYYRRHLGIVQAAAEPRPEPVDVSANAPRSDVPRPATGKANTSRSAEYAAKKELQDKTMRFLRGDTRVLRFKCIELTSGRSQGTISGLSSGVTEYCLLFYLADSCGELRMARTSRISSDDPSVILKKCRIPKNWRDRSSGHARDGDYYGPEDLLCGSTIDCFGRKILLTGCDEATRKFYAENGVNQVEVEVERPMEKGQTKQAKISANEGTGLNIGNEGIRSKAHSQSRAMSAPEHTEVLRCKCQFAGSRVAARDAERRFVVSFYLEDNTMAVFEEQGRNMGAPGGSFLKRDIYSNEMPYDTRSPRRFLSSDLFLGNTFRINGYEMRVTEMDDMSVNFCKEYPEDYPFFDIYAIIQKLMRKMLSLGIDVRDAIMNEYDVEGKSWLTEDQFMICIDDLGISRELNEQELVTLLQSFSLEVAAKGSRERRSQLEVKYLYHEMCDLFSHSYCVMAAGSASKKPSENPLDRLLDDIRARKTPWRSVLRENDKSITTFISLSDLVTCFSDNGYRLTMPNRGLIVENYALTDAEAAPILRMLEQVTGKSIVQQPQRGRGARGRRQDDEYDGERIIIDFHTFCNDIYICDWVK
eukprot:CAMPEP_0185029576 /NCGR_PEP_ID=MMETSP1103-20130426/15967_1 /TAXON_ID=36769 /ORGANISM="Paraphysomonas bandaiensis, Strain Caron Lab Isolate" /LENGTH=814 /DNA_ID=CAMNT_0027564377 /DNA_START=27 /DNA_END=2471 /DNA_ORIENTATION=-